MVPSLTCPHVRRTSQALRRSLTSLFVFFTLMLWVPTSVLGVDHGLAEKGCQAHAGVAACELRAADDCAGEAQLVGPHDHHLAELASSKQAVPAPFCWFAPVFFRFCSADCLKPSVVSVAVRGVPAPALREGSLALRI
jgi:hypothetical protein